MRHKLDSVWKEFAILFEDGLKSKTIIDPEEKLLLYNKACSLWRQIEADKEFLLKVYAMVDCPHTREIFRLFTKLNQYEDEDKLINLKRVNDD